MCKSVMKCLGLWSYLVTEEMGKSALRVRIIKDRIWTNKHILLSLDEEAEIGSIEFELSGEHPQIISFKVREAYRNKGYGRRLMNEVKNFASKQGAKVIYTYPHSDPYDDETTIDMYILCNIYSALGFEFTDKDNLGSMSICNGVGISMVCYL